MTLSNSVSNSVSASVYRSVYLSVFNSVCIPVRHYVYSVTHLSIHYAHVDALIKSYAT